MPELERITVTLSHDEWQWVLGLVMNSAYIRAKPIVEATEAAVRAAQQVREGQALRDQGERDDLLRQAQNLRGKLEVTEQVIDGLRRENNRLARQVDGYKGKIKQMGKQRGNGHDEPSPVAILQTRELEEARRTREEAERSLEESRRTVGLLQERIRTGVWPGGVEIVEGIDVAPEDD